jgi:hypothetical protein
MKKLKLDMDALVVESFEAGEARERTGTVRGHGPLSQGCPVPFTVKNDSEIEGSCGLECTGTCEYTCYVGGCLRETDINSTCSEVSYVDC